LQERATAPADEIGSQRRRNRLHCRFQVNSVTTGR
jgi:hypothetical protein